MGNQEAKSYSVSHRLKYVALEFKDKVCYLLYDKELVDNLCSSDSCGQCSVYRRSEAVRDDVFIYPDLCHCVAFLC